MSSTYSSFANDGKLMIVEFYTKCDVFSGYSCGMYIFTIVHFQNKLYFSVIKINQQSMLPIRKFIELLLKNV